MWFYEESKYGNDLNNRNEFKVVKDIFDDYFLAAFPAVLSKNATNKLLLHKEIGASVGRSISLAKI